ncbi:MFS transporter [Paraburkholderia sp. DHOC27]|uniref:MFS transporter n=1 Tax=Paraburkholderia sp. DHOC27 TaxID=2303330 RepID=UPI000E3C1428|nr:MFS transporter [Paraburkholderia sp. DHOC27]RFU44786.1 MFS transporter [Paraburkholderia sp. DHOC27]
MSTRYQPARAWGIAVLLALFMLVNFVDKIVIGLVAVPLMKDLGLTPVQFGIVGGSFFWLFAISGITGGFLANRVKASTLLLVMAVLWSASQLPVAYSTSMTVLIAARVLLGISEGPSWPVAIHACFKWFPDSRRSLPLSMIGQGATVGLLLAGFSIPLITAHWGWRANFIALGLVGVVWAVLWLLFGAEGTIGASPAGTVSGQEVAARVPYRKLLADRTVLGNFLLHFVAYWTLALVLTWLPSYLQKGLGYDAVAAGRLFALVVLIGTPISVGLSWWSQRLLAAGVASRTARGVFASIVLAVAGVLLCLLLALDLSNIQKVVLVAVAFGMTPVIYSLGPAILAEVTPGAQRGAVLAIDNSIASIAGVMAPVVTGRLVEVATGSVATGYEQGFAISGCMLMVGGVIGMFCLDPARSAHRLSGARPDPAPSTTRPV